jgi:hypothetical protein
MRIRSLAAGLLLFIAPVSANAIEIYSDEETGTDLNIGGFMQPYYRWQQDLCVPSTNADEDGNFPCTANGEESPSGFGLSRARFQFGGHAFDFASFLLVVESIPSLQLLEAQINTTITPGLIWRLGRYRVPYSGQELVSESRLSMDRAEIIRATPGRQLGSSLRLQLADMVDTLPSGFLNAEVGVFNGESDKARSPVNNIDDGYLVGGRLEVAPLGAESTRYEADLRPLNERNRPQFIVGGGYSYTYQQQEAYIQAVYGADLTVKYQGAYFYAEYMRNNQNYNTDVDRYAEGYNLQVGYMIPAPYLRDHIEVVGRYEYFDPVQPAFSDNAEDVETLRPSAPGGGAATSRLQGQNTWIGGVNWYVKGNHDFKVQANYTHRIASEDWRGSAAQDAIPADDTDDTFLLQVTYRF